MIIGVIRVPGRILLCGSGGRNPSTDGDLIHRGAIPRDESIVVCVTGNGYKTTEVVAREVAQPVRLSRAFKDFEAWWASRATEPADDVVLS